MPLLSFSVFFSVSLHSFMSIFHILLHHLYPPFLCFISFSLLLIFISLTSWLFPLLILLHIISFLIIHIFYMLFILIFILLLFHLFFVIPLMTAVAHNCYCQRWMNLNAFFFLLFLWPFFFKILICTTSAILLHFLPFFLSIPDLRFISWWGDPLHRFPYFTDLFGNNLQVFQG